MKKLCPPELQLGKKDFLGQGADAQGKADFQGCGEFNPLLLFSKEQQAEFDRAQQKQDKTGIDRRNNANAPNRRVMVPLFRKGSKVDPPKWPLPARDGGKCRVRQAILVGRRGSTLQARIGEGTEIRGDAGYVCVRFLPAAYEQLAVRSDPVDVQNTPVRFLRRGAARRSGDLGRRSVAGAYRRCQRRDHSARHWRRSRKD